MSKPVRFHFFIAVMPPESVSHALYSALQPYRKYKDWVWKRPSDYHITLQTPGVTPDVGMVEGANSQEFLKGFEGIRINPAPIIDLTHFDTLMGMGDKDHVLSVRFDEAARVALGHLQTRINTRLTNMGYDYSPLSFNPHLTLARVPQIHREILLNLKRSTELDTALKEWTAQSFQILQVKHNEAGIQYRTLATHDLATGDMTHVNQPEGRKPRQRRLEPARA